MEVILFSKNVPGSLYFKMLMGEINQNCTCVFSLAELLRTIRQIDPQMVFTDTRQINLYGFNTRQHLKEYNARFEYYDLYSEYYSGLEIPYPEIFSSLVEKYELFVEIQEYNFSKEETNINIKNCFKKYKFQQHHIKILQLFFNAPNVSHPSEKLLEVLWEHSSSSITQNSSEHLSTLYSYISQINKILKNASMNCSISRSGKGFYSFIL